MKRRTFLMSAAGGSLLLTGRPLRAAPVSYVVNPLPTPVSQGKTNLCWLAASAAMFSYKDNKPYTLTDAATRLGGVYVVKQIQEQALSYDELDTWLFAGGFQREGQQSLDSGGWEQLLKSHGPLITLIDGSGTGNINHAVVVVGIVGDGTQTGTTIRFADSQSGQIETAKLEDFTKVFALPSGANTLFSVAYFK